MQEILNYMPSDFDYTIEPLPVPSAWVGLEKIIRPMLADFDIKPNKAIEFGVDWGYSMSALAQVFQEVIGVDHFQGDDSTGHVPDHAKVTRWMSQWPNAKIIVEPFEQFFANSSNIGEKWDFCHIDLSNSYEEVFACGNEAIKRCDCVIFHDTEAFADVKRACLDLADQADMNLYNYPHNYGLGILVSKSKTQFFQNKKKVEGT